MLGIRTAEFCGKGKVPIGVPELGVAIEQRHRIQRDQFTVLLAQDHGVHFQILGIFAVKAGKHLASEISHFLQERTAEARILGQPLERVRRGLLPDFQCQAIHTFPIRFDFNAAAVGDQNVRPCTGGFHRTIIFFLMRNHFRYDHLRDGDATHVATDHLLGRCFCSFEVQIDLHQAELESRAERFMSLDH